MDYICPGGTLPSYTSDYNKTRVYLSLMDTLSNNTNISEDNMFMLRDYNNTIYKSDLEDIYSKPMLLIGVYIAVASLACVIAMGADLLLNLRSKNLWFPCKWFTINAFYLTVIAVTMKLPVDLSGSMPGDVDQVSKLGSLAFMCTMMANFLPCLAKMPSNELLANITALGVLIITLVVNVCIQVATGVVSTYGAKATTNVLRLITHGCNPRGLKVIGRISFTTIATIYTTLLLLLLIIHVCSSLAILKSKQIIESKYQQGHETASKEVQGSILTVEKLQKHVSNYWIMAGSGSPQFIIACFVTTTASGVICVLTFILHVLTMGYLIQDIGKEYESDYKWSTLLILIVQSIGVLVGTVAPFLRCFASLSLKMSSKVILNQINVFKVESYWTQKLSDWKRKRLPFRFRSLDRKVKLKTWKSWALDVCIIFQEVVVVLCKIIAWIPFFIMICFFHLKHVVFGSLGEGTEKLEQSPYVLHLENDTELAKSTLIHFSKSLNLLIQESEKKQPKNLMNLIKEKSTKDFQGVKKFDNNNHRDCWSLAMVTLTAIAVTLREIKKEEVDSLVKSVREGLEYVILVEENLNATDDYVSIQKAAGMLWQEVDVDAEWLGIKLKDIASEVHANSSEGDKTLKIVQLFLQKAKGKISEGVGTTDNGSLNDDSAFKSICMNSMSHITKTLIDDHNESHKKSFDELISSRIADIMAACLTNLPQVIAMKCHVNVIEKREASVQAAAKILGETKQIINYLHDHDVPSKEDRPFIDKWGAYLSGP